MGKTKLMNNIFAKGTTPFKEHAQNMTNKVKPGYTLVINGRLAGDMSLEKAMVRKMCELSEDLVKIPTKQRLDEIAGLSPISLLINSISSFTGLSVSLSSSLVEAVAALTISKGDPTITAFDILPATTNSKKTPLKMRVIDEADHFFMPPEAKAYLKSGKTTAERETKGKQIIETLQGVSGVHEGERCFECSALYIRSFISICSKSSWFFFDFKFFDTQIIVVCEPSPSAAIATVKSWGVGDNLAFTLVDMYGGHLATIFKSMVVEKNWWASGETS